LILLIYDHARPKEGGYTVKKAVLIFLIIAATLSFSACNPQKDSAATSLTQGIKITDMGENIGKTKDEVFKNLNIVEDKDVETSDRMPGSYILKEKQKFANEDLELAINFDINNGEMYGFMYFKNFDNDHKGAYDLTKKLYDALSEEYKYPITYPELPHRISNMPSYEELSREKGVPSYKEEWKAEGDMSVTLESYFIPDAGAQVTVKYQIGIPTVRSVGPNPAAGNNQ